MHGGVLQSHGGGRGEVHRGCRYIQLSGATARHIREQLAESPPEYQEGAPILVLVEKATTERGRESVNGVTQASRRIRNPQRRENVVPCE